MAKRPLILVTNDDGILAPGIGVLADALGDLGQVMVCAPETERSGASHSITLHSHLRVNPVRDGWWSLNGTPVDCVYLAALHLCAHPPDLVVSGINAGYNLGTDVFYSGTVGGAAEGWIRGASAMAVSVHREDDPRLATAAIRRLARLLLEDSDRHLWNINVGRLGTSSRHPPTGDELTSMGAEMPVHVTRLGQRPYLDQVEQRRDPQGRTYFWIGGPPEEGRERQGEDTWSVAQGAISLTPLELDITATDLTRVERLMDRLSPEKERP